MSLSEFILKVADIILRLALRVNSHNHTIKQTQLQEHFLIDSPVGWSKIAASHIKEAEPVYEVELSNGLKSKMGSGHLVYISDTDTESVQNLGLGDVVLTRKGRSYVTQKRLVSSNMLTFDLTVVNSFNCYYTDDIISHNSVVTGIFLVWYALFNKDKDIVALSQNDDKVVDLLGKMESIVRRLPYFLKPGMLKKNEHTLHFDNNTRIKANTTSGTSAAGISADILYIDEFALIDDRFINIFYRTTYPTISASLKSRVIITSTPRGFNKFWEIYHNALLGENRYNPLRVDYWEVPGRDEKWRLDEIKNLGTIEDFNQEYGNQFISGANSIFNSDTSKLVMQFETEYVHKDIEELNDIPALEYEGILTWNKNFDLSLFDDPGTKFQLSTDLADGDGGDNLVTSIWLILPKTKAEIDLMPFYSDERDFFKTIQVGKMSHNKVSIKEFGRLFYYLVVKVLTEDKVKCTLEVNHGASEFINTLESVEGDKNNIDVDEIMSKYLHKKGAVTPKIGIKTLDYVKNEASGWLKDDVAYRSIILTDPVTIRESTNFMKSGKTYKAQAGHDDHIMTAVLHAAARHNDDFLEQIEEMLDYMPEAFIKLMEEKLNIETNDDIKDPDDIEEIFDDENEEVFDVEDEDDDYIDYF